MLTIIEFICWFVAPSILFNPVFPIVAPIQVTITLLSGSVFSKSNPFLETFFVSSKKELNKIKDFPVVIKTANDVLHKKQVGLVKQNIGNQKDLFFHFQKMKRVLVQKQITGFEFFCGMKRDESFGTVLSFGQGGNVELFADTSFGILPLNKIEIVEMMKRTKAFSVIEEKERLFFHRF